jgi:type IV pilus assembly protein PilA
MLARLRKAQEEHDGGFTLIELLVVIIIIGILAAIAIPVFLKQRQKGYDAGVKSDLRNAATAEETWLTDNNVYTTTEADLITAGFKESSNADYLNGTANSNLTIEFLDNGGAKSTTNATSGYCISAKSASGNTFAYNSEAGGLQPGTSATCP